MDDYVAGGVLATGEGVRMGAAVESKYSVARRYYDAYEAYLREVGRSDESSRTDGACVHGVEACKYRAVPPVWVGYSSECYATVGGVGGTVRRSLPAPSGYDGAREPGDDDARRGVPGDGVRWHADLVGVASGDKVCSDGVDRDDFVETSAHAGDSVVGIECRGKNFLSNKKKRDKRKAMRQNWREPRVGSDGGCLSSGSEVGSVKTVDTRTGVEIEAAQTLAARRVAENRVAVKLAELKLRRLGDEGRTAVVERLAAATFEKRINEARSKAQKSFDGSEDSLKSLGSMGSAGELYARQAIKKSRDDAKTLKYVQSQAELLLRYATPEVRQMVTDMPRPEYEDEFDVFGDCPDSFDEGDREAYYDRLAARNAELSLLSQ